MNVHEYQAKALLREYGVPVPPGRLASTPAEAEAAARSLGADVLVVKAQVHAGGRGKAGGIKLARSTAETKTLAGEILGMTLRSQQTGPEGRVVRKRLDEAQVLLVEQSDLAAAVEVDDPFRAAGLWASRCSSSRRWRLQREIPLSRKS